MRKSNKICIYRHIRLDNNTVFYIGIGYIKRAYAKDNRNKHWLNTINKTEYEVQILKTDLIWKDACELERNLISYYGRRDLKTGTLVNLTDGGEGSLNRRISDETRKKLGRGKENNKWWVGRKHTDETKLKISLARKNRIQKNTSKKVKDLDLNIIFNTCTEAAKYYNISPSTLTYHLKNKNSKINIITFE